MKNVSSLRLVIIYALSLLSLLTIEYGQAEEIIYYPASDPNNQKNWILRKKLSDEFDKPGLPSEEKWSFGGEGDCNTSSESASAVCWDGRAPALFTRDNARVDDNGILHLTTKYEPNNEKFFPHLDEDDNDIIDDDCDCKYEKYTSAAVVSKYGFKYGYFEVRAKVAPVSMSSAFWAIGECFEIDVFEIVGQPQNDDCETNDFASCQNATEMPSCVHKNYNKDGYCKSTDLDNDLTKDFHVYGADWTHNRIKFYADGKLTHVLKKKTGKKKKQWPWKKKKDCKMYIWLDNEAFSWQGLPTKESLPADYEIDYVRVWKR